MLTANQLHIDGRHHTLLPPTTVEAQRAQVLLIQADGQERRTALSLALTGRMKPSTGTVVLGHDPSMATLRKRSAIVDSPEVNAPENHLSVRSLVSEDLALVPLKFRDRTRPTAWLVKRGFRDILEKWVEEVEPNRLLHLQLELALANQFVDLLVVDSPDRHTADTNAWLPLLERTAAGKIGLVPDANAGTLPRTLIVIAVVGRLPDGWTGPATVAGTAAVAGAAAEVVEPLDHAGDGTADAPERGATAPGTRDAPDTEPPEAEPAKTAEAPVAESTEIPLTDASETPEPPATAEAGGHSPGSRHARPPEAPGPNESPDTAGAGGAGVGVGGESAGSRPALPPVPAAEEARKVTGVAPVDAGEVPTTEGKEKQ